MLLIMVLLMTQAFPPGAHISNPDPDKIVIVRTELESPQDHHKVLDDPANSRLRPFTVTIKAKDKAIRSVTVQWTVVDANGGVRTFPQIFDMPTGSGWLVKRNSNTEFWPGGSMPGANDVPKEAKPLMGKLPPATMDLFEQAKSVTFSVDRVEYEDGTTYGPDSLGSSRQILETRARRGR